jgi:competence protein ComGC
MIGFALVGALVVAGIIIVGLMLIAKAIKVKDQINLKGNKDE